MSKPRPVRAPCDIPECRSELDVWRVPKYEMSLCVRCRAWAREFDAGHAERRAMIARMLREKT